MRHGQAVNNVKRMLAGRSPGISLTDEGRRQAAAAAELLSDMRISRILTSPIERAVQTAEIVSGRIGVRHEADDRLVELDMGKFTGMGYGEVLSKHGNVFHKFYSGDLELAHNGVETFDMVKRRVSSLLDEMAAGDGDAADGGGGGGGGGGGAASGGPVGTSPAGAAAGGGEGNTLLVTHMDPIKAALSASAGLGPDLLLNLVVANASLTVFVRHDGRLWLKALNVLDPARYAEPW